jgi:hypothetical protein
MILEVAILDVKPAETGAFTDSFMFEGNDRIPLLMQTLLEDRAG